MHSPDAAESPKASRLRAYTWGVLAVLTCPCHLPGLAVMLAGTTAGSVLGEHWGIAALALTVLFVFFLASAMRALGGRS